MRTASYRNSKISVVHHVQEALSAIAGSAFFIPYINFLSDKGKPIVRWGRKAAESMQSIMDSLATEVGRMYYLLFSPPVHCVPACRFGCRIVKGERNEQTYR